MNAEEHVIGACFLSEDAIRFASDIITPRDFNDLRLGKVFSLMVAMRSQREPVILDAVVAKAQERNLRGVDWAYLFNITSSISTAATVDFYAQEVKKNAIRRALHTEGQRLLQASSLDGVDSAKALSESITSLQAIRDDASNDTYHAKTLGEVLAVEDEETWLIDGLLEPGDRMIITGAEGLGKSTWVRQLGISMAAGLHPVTFAPMRSVRTLVVDAENTERQWRREVRGIRHVAAKHGHADPADVLKLACVGWLDITRDEHLGLVHRLIDEHDPEVLFIGPLYRLTSGSLNDETDAAKVLHALDTFRARDVALIIEAHSPKGGFGEREWSPRGSGAIMGWPEFGFGLAPDDNNAGNAHVRRWRGDRDRKREWPKYLHRGGAFPWMSEETPQHRRLELLRAS